jgi:hypothetical protein
VCLNYFFARAKEHPVMAGFDGWAITSHAGALLVGATDCTINLIACFAALPTRLAMRR